MKKIKFAALFSLLAAFTSLPALHAEGSLPFAVNVGGQQATYKAGEAFAKLEKPVAANAPVSVAAKADMVIINIHKMKADGTTDETAQPAIILLQGTDKGSLDQTMDKQKLPAGKYLLSITAGEATATIQFEIQ
ncbi:hypothetical protein [Verrucomicrobium sp. BvORR106]|uniref:hypothetical protein n=1 Tax=Verrucomicrobium sp. BvORR106 TaxID=1403819 RepID=UPI00056E8116|nr:hypothetical protein [Verrucomicrobium sp. BvORR106]